jgi:L-lactate dehydrogenase complex protein LldG
MTARDEVLARIHIGLRDVPAAETPEMVAVSRDYRHVDTRPHAALVEEFAEQVADYKAKVSRVTSAELPDAIAQACAARGVRRLVVPVDLPGEWLPAGIEALRDESLTDTQLDESDGVLTGCAIGIAQTGTIVLDGGALQGRRVISLLPDYHLCVIRENQIVGLVPEAITALAEGAHTNRRPMTFISGPSATSDIELNRVEGVHGPRTLEVLIVGG